MGLRAFAKKYLGETRIWLPMLKAKARAGQFLEKIPVKRASLKAGVYTRRLLILLLPKRLIYRLLQTSFFYGAAYFDKPKNALKESGYGEGYNEATEFQEVAGLVEELFNPRKVLDIGCAKGFQVAALRSRGIEASGIDISEYAIASAPPEVSPWLQVGSCTRLNFPDRSFDLLLVLETLEHIPPNKIAQVLAELCRVTGKWIWVSIPSIGGNKYGIDGFYEGKIKERFLPLYGERTIDFVPFSHLLVDVNHIPIHGHISIASFDWWTALFNRFGFVRRGGKEMKINETLEPARVGLWNCMVFEKIEERATRAPANSALELQEVEPGVYESEFFRLPPGVQTPRLAFELADGWRADEEERVLHAEVISEEGLSVNGSRVVSARELRKAARGGSVRVEMNFCALDGESVHMRLEAHPGLRTLSRPRIEMAALEEA